MSEEIAKHHGLVIGQKVLYPDTTSEAVILRILTMKDIKNGSINNKRKTQTLLK